MNIVNSSDNGRPPGTLQELAQELVELVHIKLQQSGSDKWRDQSVQCALEKHLWDDQLAEISSDLQKAQAQLVVKCVELLSTTVLTTHHFIKIMIEKKTGSSYEFTLVLSHQPLHPASS